ncbi:MAG TPA: homoserine kinase [Ruminococcaceae bacterium]|nr:homoserine kinase [Oscillospiraceae bacterium]
MIKIRIPATSANIGSGFDSLGLAVNMYNYVYMEESDSLEISSKDGTIIPTNESNLIYKTAKYLFEECGRPFKSLKIEQINNVPIARGLGSSSTCIIGGLVGANELMGCPLSKDELINLAAAMEGHPDNSTPAMIGGLVTAVLDNKKVYYVKQEIDSALKFAAIVPDFELKTSDARRVLPQQIAHKDGVFNLSRAALMSVSLYSGNYNNLRVAADDRLHQPYRLSLINKAEQVFDICYKNSAYAVYISGAGSTLMAIVDDKQIDFEQKTRDALDEMGLGEWKLHMLSVDNAGTVVLKD